MLSAAQREKAGGVRVVVGYVEPHGRPETEALLAGLENLPTLRRSLQGVTLREFDLDAALELKPALILVDELAHTNVEGSRHAKRWQDVEELRDAGIDVWTTLNVQHIESLNDVIAQITGVVIRETLPDAVLETADEIELIDVTPEELVDRLQAGKVYIPQQAARALQNFFHRGNLVALRELSLRQAANRLQRDVEEARQERSVLAPWLTSERLLVCVGPSPSSASNRAEHQAARRFAGCGVAGGRGADGRPGGRGRTQLAANGRQSQARREAGRRDADADWPFGAGDATAVRPRAECLEDRCRAKTALPWWKRIFGTIVDDLLKTADEIDIYVVSARMRKRPPLVARAAKSEIVWRDYAAAAPSWRPVCGLGWLAHVVDSPRPTSS